MMIYCGSLFIFISFALVLSVSGREANETIEFVTILFRHGDRTPVQPYPNDPYKDPANWPVGLGELTAQGKLRHFQLGKHIRTRYADLLGNDYSPAKVNVRSTDTDRTLMSAEAHLAGLFPPSAGRSWKKDLKWQPIPVHTVEQKEDNLLSQHAVCHRMNVLRKQVLNSDFFQQLDRNNSQLYAALSRYSGRKVDSVTQVDYLYDTLLIETIFNKTLPAWTVGLFPDKMKPLRDLSFQISTWTPEMKRLRSGVLIKTVLERYQSIQDGGHHPASSPTGDSSELEEDGEEAVLDLNELKMQVYSAHDTTLANLLNTLDLLDPPYAPNYAATLAIELVKSHENIFYVRFLYFQSDDKPVDLAREDAYFNFQTLTVPGCPVRSDGLCKLSHFEALVQNYIPINWNSECENDKVWNNDFIAAHPGRVIIVFLAILMCILSLFLVIRRFLSIRNNSKGGKYVLMRKH